LILDVFVNAIPIPELFHVKRRPTLEGQIQIARGDSSTFSAERALAPAQHIPDPPSYADKWIRYR
jgi:hypothetical protein